MNLKIPHELQDLHAYVDNELLPHEERRVEAYLQQHPEEKQRIDDYKALKEGLKALYDPVLSESVPPRLVFYRRRVGRPLAAIAASLLLLVIGGWTGWLLHDADILPIDSSEYVVHEAATAYAVYTPEVKHPVEVPATQAQHLVAWLTKRLGAPIKVPSLDSLGFGLVGGRLLSTEEGPGALFMYEDATGRRIVMYLCHNLDNKPNTSLRFAQHNQISVFYWFDGKFSYAVAGELERSMLLDLSEAVYKEIAM